MASKVNAAQTRRRRSGNGGARRVPREVEIGDTQDAVGKAHYTRPEVYAELQKNPDKKKQKTRGQSALISSCRIVREVFFNKPPGTPLTNHHTYLEALGIQACGIENANPCTVCIEKNPRFSGGCISMPIGSKGKDQALFSGSCASCHYGAQGTYCSSRPDRATSNSESATPEVSSRVEEELPVKMETHTRSMPSSSRNAKRLPAASAASHYFISESAEAHSMSPGDFYPPAQRKGKERAVESPSYSVSPPKALLFQFIKVRHIHIGTKYDLNTVEGCAKASDDALHIAETLAYRGGRIADEEEVEQLGLSEGNKTDSEMED